MSDTERMWAVHYADQAREATDNRNNAIRNLRAAGVTYDEIAAMVGLSRTAVRKIVARSTD